MMEVGSLDGSDPLQWKTTSPLRTTHAAASSSLEATISLSGVVIIQTSAGRIASMEAPACRCP